MIVPGLPSPLGAANLDFGYLISSDTGNFDLFAAAGSPTGLVRVHLGIASGVTVWSERMDFGTSEANKSVSIDCEGFSSGSIIFITNFGAIRSHGGRGGRGCSGDLDRGDRRDFAGGGGGGGNGYEFGNGGDNTPFGDPGTSTDGSPGSDTYPGAGGAPGSNDLTENNAGAGTPAALPGGTCIRGASDPTVATYLLNLGTVWAGGGGGLGGYRSDDIVYGPYAGGGYGENGGGYDEFGSFTFTQNFAGHATENVTILAGGSSPEMLGTNV